MGHGAALISEHRFMSYSLAFQGITFGALWTASISVGKRLWDGFGTSIAPLRGIRGDGLGDARGRPRTAPHPAPLGSRHLTFRTGYDCIHARPYSGEPAMQRNRKLVTRNTSFSGVFHGPCHERRDDKRGIPPHANGALDNLHRNAPMKVP